MPWSPVWLLRRMTPKSARFEQSGPPFSTHARALQKAVGRDGPGGAGQIRAGNASRMEGLARCGLERPSVPFETGLPNMAGLAKNAG